MEVFSFSSVVVLLSRLLPEERLCGRGSVRLDAPKLGMRDPPSVWVRVEEMDTLVPSERRGCVLRLVRILETSGPSSWSQSLCASSSVSDAELS